MTEDEVRALYFDLLDAWNRRDAKGYATLFVHSGQIVGFDGSQVPADQLADYLDGIFADHPTSPYVAKVRWVRPLGRDAALLFAVAGMVPPGQDRLNPAVNAVHSLVAQRDHGTWRIVLFQNTPAAYHGRPDLAEAHTAELESQLS